MAFLKFNKSELVNLSYSLKREIISANKTGAYCNTSIVTCNTRRYHGLLAVTLDRFGGDKFLLLSSLDESLVVNGKQFNLGIHCYRYPLLRRHLRAPRAQVRGRFQGRPRPADHLQGR